MENSTIHKIVIAFISLLGLTFSLRIDLNKINLYSNLTSQLSYIVIGILLLFLLSNFCIKWIFSSSFFISFLLVLFPCCFVANENLYDIIFTIGGLIKIIFIGWIIYFFSDNKFNNKQKYIYFLIIWILSLICLFTLNRLNDILIIVLTSFAISLCLNKLEKKQKYFIYGIISSVFIFWLITHFLSPPIFESDKMQIIFGNISGKGLSADLISDNLLNEKAFKKATLLTIVEQFGIFGFMLINLSFMFFFTWLCHQFYKEKTIDNLVIFFLGFIMILQMIFHTLANLFNLSWLSCPLPLLSGGQADIVNILFLLGIIFSLKASIIKKEIII